jgi:acetyltransferase
MMSPATAGDGLALVETLQLRGGPVVTVRPARPGDGDIIQCYIRGLSPSSRRNRFLGALNEVSLAELDRITHSHDRRQIALVAETCDATCAMIGEARAAVAPDGPSGEIALSVAEAWRRKTLGTQLLGLLVRHARSLGVRYLVADVLRSNDAVTALARKMGFRVAAPIEDTRLLRLTKPISLQDPERPHAGLLQRVA